MKITQAEARRMLRALRRVVNSYKWAAGPEHNAYYEVQEYAERVLKRLQCAKAPQRRGV